MVFVDHVYYGSIIVGKILLLKKNQLKLKYFKTENKIYTSK